MTLHGVPRGPLVGRGRVASRAEYLMLRTVDRYVIREVGAPFTIVLLVFTFMLLMGPIMDVADQLIAKGVAWSIVARYLRAAYRLHLGQSGRDVSLGLRCGEFREASPFSP